MKTPFFLFILLLLAVPLGASAATFLVNESVTPLEAIADDIYALGDRVGIQHAIDGDAFIAGGVIDIEGPVDGDVFAAGETLSVSGRVADDTFAAGNIVDIATEATEDVFAAGATITISPVTVATGSAYLAGDNVVIGGDIAGDVWVAGGEIHITDGTTIGGDLRSYAEAEPVLGDNVTIGGEVQHSARTAAPHSTKSDVLDWVRSVVALFIGAAVLLYLMPASSQRVVDTAAKKPAIAFGLGVLWLLLVVPVIVVLFITFIGAPLAVLLIGVAIAVFVAAWLYSALVIGERAFGWITKKPVTTLSWQHALLGAVILSVLSFVPIVGWLVAAIIFIAALGSVLLVRWSEFRSDYD